MKSILLITTALTACCLSTSLHAKKTQSNRVEAWSTEQQLAGFKLADDFIIELVACEKNGLINPIDLTFDDSGRLWTQTAQMYPLDPLANLKFGEILRLMKDPKIGEKYPRVKEIENYYKLKTKGKDKILIIDDPTKQASGPLHVWADGLAIPQSILPYKNGCYVAHGSEFLFLSDENKDGKQDKVETVMTGFGFFDTHTMAHSLVRGPGGWINFSHGALNSGKVHLPKSGQKLEVTYAKNLRVNLEGTRLEVLNIARDNVWGYQILSNGQWYATSANDHGLSVLPMEDQTGISGIGGDTIRSYQPMIRSVHKFRVGGTGISGLAFSEDGNHGFPGFKNVAILANPITHSINCVRIERLADGSIKAEPLPDLLQSEDDWFRPVNIEIGPDGCLYIADWYNKIVSHNEVRRDHPDRDRSHGRIWRIRHKSQKPLSIPNVATAENASLLKHLQGKTLWERRAAWHQIVDRGAKELTTDLKKLALDPKAEKGIRILALWSLEGLNSFDINVLKTSIADPDGDIRREAIRSLASYRPGASVTAKLLKPYVNDTNAMVRSQVIRTLEEIQEANHSTIALLVEASKPAAPNNAFGGNYERNFERFLTRKALESYPEPLKSFLKSSEANQFPGSNILWAVQALSGEERKALFLSNWEKSEGSVEKNTFISITKMLSDPEIKKAVTPSFQKQSGALLKLAIENKFSIDGPALSPFYKEKISGLLGSKDSSDIEKGISLVNDLRSPHHSNELLKILNGHTDPNLQKLAFHALAHGSTHPRVYLGLVKDEKRDFGLRMSALAALAIVNNAEAQSALLKWLPKLSDSQKKAIVFRLSFTKQGSAILKTMWKNSLLKKQHLDYPSAARIARFDGRDARGKEMFKIASKKESDDLEAIKHKIIKLSKAANTLKGNPELGKAMFMSCLACHKVGQDGNEIAPPLDGSANRNTEHLITAIVAPDEAVEGAFGLYYAVRKDGFVKQGYLAKRDSNGIIIAEAGGAESFIANDRLLSHGSVHGRSFMPRSFGDLPEQSMVDLISYIKTLE